jgi:hypothetical protein
MYEQTLRCVHENIVSVESKCVFVALVMWHVRCMCHIILSSVAYLALTCCSTLSHKQQFF